MKDGRKRSDWMFNFHLDSEGDSAYNCRLQSLYDRINLTLTVRDGLSPCKARP